MSLFEVVDPATEAVIERLPSATAEDADAAVARAGAAFEGWRAVAPADRSRLLRRLAERLDAERERLAQLEMRNTGKPIGDARGEMGMVADTFAYYAGAPERLLGDTIPVAGGVDLTFREPLGVVGLIVPWNFPLAIASWKLAPALAAGNTVVLKPAELTPLTALAFQTIAEEAGIPPGVVNVLAGPGRVVGQRLVEHPGVAKVAFTGSTEVGRGIMQGAAGTIKRVTLELGGKSANLVFADADLAAAAAAAPLAVFGNAGQDCCARSRILVERPAMDEFLSLLEPEVTGLVVGDPADERTQMGPLISAGQRETVASFVPYLVSFGLLPLWIAAGVGVPLERVAPAALLVGPFAVAAHLANTLQDFEGDAAVRSGNLAQRLGRSRALVLAIVLAAGVGIGAGIGLAANGRLGPPSLLLGVLGLLAIAQGIEGAPRLWAGMLVAAVSWTAAWAFATG